MKATKEEYQDYHDRLFNDVEGIESVNWGDGLEFTDPDAEALHKQAIDKEKNARLSKVSENLVTTANKLLADTKHTTLADAEYLEIMKSGIERSKSEFINDKLEQKLSEENDFWVNINNGTRKTPQQLDYIALAYDTNRSKAGEYTLNPDMDDFPLDEQAKQVKDIADQIPEDVKEGGIKAVGEWLKSQTKKDASGNDVPKYRLPDLRLYQYLADNYEDETKVPKALAEKLMDGDWHNLYGSVVRDIDGDWRVPQLDRDGDVLDRHRSWLGNDWDSYDRVLVFET